MAAPLISSDSAFPPDRLDSLFRLELSGLGGMIRNSQIRKCALTIGADPRSQDRVFLEFYRSDDKHPIVMSRPTRELAKVYEIDARDRAVLERLALIPAFDPFTLRTALRKAGRDLRKAGVLEAEAAEPDEAVLSLSAGTRGMLAEHTIRFTDPLLGALLGPVGDPSKTPAERLAEAEANADPDARAALSRNGLLLRRKFSAASLSDLTELIEDFGEKFLSISSGIPSFSKPRATREL